MKDDDIIICRCEDITLGEIKKAIEMGATDLSSIKRITRSGMGTCQGKICESLIRGIIKSGLGINFKDLNLLKIRPPIYPITIRGIAEIDEYKEK